jgi:hypothetical protein
MAKSVGDKFGPSNLQNRDFSIHFLNLSYSRRHSFRGKLGVIEMTEITLNGKAVVTMNVIDLGESLINLNFIFKDGKTENRGYFKEEC